MHRRSFSVKLIILMVLIVCLPLLIVSLQTIVRIRALTLQNNKEMNQNNLDSMSNNINVYFDQYRRITDLLFISKDIQNVASQNPVTRVDKYQAAKQFENAASGITFNFSDLDNVYLFSSSGQEYFLQGNQYLPYVRECCQNYLDDNPSLNTSTLSVTGFFIGDKASQLQYKILFLRPLFNYVTREYLGMLALEFSPDTFSKLLGYSSDITLVVSEDNVILYNSMNNHLSESVNAIFNDTYSSDEFEDVEVDGKPYTYTSISTEYTWKIICLVDSSLSSQLVFSAVLPILLATLLCITIFLAIAVSMTNRIVLPVKQLKALTVKVGEGDLSVRADIHTGDEFEVLADSYNHMLDQLNQIIERACNAEGMRIDAEYRALQSQINPHFLYNTLETINSLAQINGQHEISQMICSLADMFRYSTHQSAKLVTVQEELSYLHNYMFLQSFGYEDVLHITYAIPDDLLQLPIPKVILQPLVENCLNHAFDGTFRECHILVSGKIDQDFLEFTVTDDGIGMTQEQLTILNEKLSSEDPQPDKGSIGLTNIHRRLKLLFGPGSGLSITSNPGCGTTVLMKIKLDQQSIRQLT